MGTIIKELDKNLVIFEPKDETKTDDDILYYLYKEIPEPLKEDISIDELDNYGERIITMRELDLNVSRKIASIITSVAKKSKDKDSSALGYRLFSFLLRVKISMDTILSYAYAKSLVELSDKIVNSEADIAYNLSQYLLEKLNYKSKFMQLVLNILTNKDEFKEYYEVLKKGIDDIEEGLSAKTIKEVYKKFNDIIRILG
jgi:hypothetical protein